MALRRSLGNLLSNAAEYGVAGRSLQLETVAADSTGGTEAQIRIHDRGDGIPPAEESKIFDPFERAGGTRSTPVTRSGPGLKITRDMAQDMGAADAG